jgi:uncharacterized membrane protein
MSALIFLFLVALIFGVVLAVEAHDTDLQSPRRPLGLIGWLTGGNWPAKLGGGLLVVGCGALLRYALINLDFPPAIKLASGAVAAGLLGLAATLTRGARRRAVSLALGGAAFGVAYMTAYSAFALFNYCSSPAGVALLALTAAGAGVYAITRGALSLALLAMIGAYLAPAFATADPGPATVMAYLAGASLLSLVMVAARGWRPLIHLSFLFTLGGGVFFAWTAKYYSPQHAGVMLPALVVLAALHVLMPIVERRGSSGIWIERLDIAYTILLPAAAGLSAFLIAPARADLSNGLLALSAVWFAAATYLACVRRDGAVLHGVIGVLLSGSAVAARFRDLPWELIALAFSVIAFWLAARRSQSTRLQDALASLVPVAGFLYVLDSLSMSDTGTIFLNTVFFERLAGAGLLMLAGQIARTIRNKLDTLLWTVGVGWGLTAIGFELVRWDLVSLSVLVHWTFLAAAAYLAFSRSTHRSIPDALIIVILGVAASAVLAAVKAPAPVSWGSLIAAPLILSWLSIRRAGADPQTRVGRTLAAMTAPVVAGVWAIHAGALAGIRAPQFVFCTIVSAALCLVVLGDVARNRCRDWRPTAVHLYAYLFAVPLAISTTIAISRSAWAIALELLCSAGLLLLVVREQKEAPLPRWVAPGCALGAGLVIQANLLRWLGPPGNLGIWDLAHMRSTALVSLVWATLGAVMTVWGRRRVSRTLWLAGASLLVAAAAKLVLIDFGVLGQLANILAVIAAGIVFLLVGWLAPMPPARPRVSPPPRRPDAAGHAGGSPGGDPQSAPSGAASAARPSPSPVTRTQPEISATPAAPAGTVKEYWDWNTTRTPAATASMNWESARSDRLIWTIAILGVIVFLLVHWRLGVHPPPETVTVRSLGPTAPDVSVEQRNVPTMQRRAEHSVTAPASENAVANTPQPALPPDEAAPAPATEPVQTPSAALATFSVPPAPRIVRAIYASPRGGRQFDVTQQLRASCANAPTSCMVTCGNQLAGDPDFGIRKRCEIAYRCGSAGTQSVQVLEGENLTLTCQ